MNNRVQSNQYRAFTLVEMLVVIAIISLLAALAFPMISKAMLKSYETRTLASLKQHSVAFSLYAADNDGYLPAGGVIAGQPENAQSWWLYSLKPYFQTKDEVQFGTTIMDPYYYKLVGGENFWWRPGWAMNARMGLAAGDGVGLWNTSSSYYVRYKMARYPSNTVLLGPAFWQYFSPNNDGTVNDDRFSQTKTYNVPHTRRIGADKNGRNGKSAYYLMVDGAAQNMTPAQAAEVLKLRNL